MTRASEPRGEREVLVFDADPALLGLLQAWLDDCRVSAVASGDAAPAAAPPHALLIIDLNFPRDGGAQRVRRIAERHPGVPILALSPAVFACVDCHGAVARALGVDAVVALPVSREALTCAARALLSR
jgi:CheY-like chemotaxis protein